MTSLTQSSPSSLTNMVWVSSAFIALAECGGLTILCKEEIFENIQERTNLPAELLSAILELLVEAKYVVKNKNYYCFSEELIENIKKEQPSRILALLRTNYGQAHELVNSARENRMSLGWQYTQDYLLQAQGETSERIVTQIFNQFPAVKAAISKRDARFLDVGAGVCAISIKACEIYPNLTVVSLEPADKPFQLGQRNIKKSNLENRIDLRKLLLEDLHEEDKFDLVWFPQAFIPNEILSKCLFTIRQALKADGILLTHAMSSVKPGVGASISRLKNVLFGGGVRSSHSLLEVLKIAGFKEIQMYEESSGMAIMGVKCN